MSGAAPLYRSSVTSLYVVATDECIAYRVGRVEVINLQIRILLFLEINIDLQIIMPCSHT